MLVRMVLAASLTLPWKLLVEAPWGPPTAISAVTWALLGAAPAAAARPGDLVAPLDPQEIVGGRTTTPGDWDGVVAIVAGGGLCTGTVVSPRLVLTAAHCLVDLGEGAEDQIKVYYGSTLQAHAPVGVTQYGSHPKFCPGCKEDIYDYGYVVIDADFEVGGGVILPLANEDEWEQAMVPGREVTLVGYGEDPEVGGIDAGIGVQRQVTTTIRRLTARGFEFYAGGMDQDSCKGDSGGPAFVNLGNGITRLVGITSRGSDPCGDGGYYSAPYPALCWVRDETGIDLVGPTCAACDCIDTAPPGDDGCAVAEPDQRIALGGLLGVALLVRLRRRRRRR